MDGLSLCQVRGHPNLGILGWLMAVEKCFIHIIHTLNPMEVLTPLGLSRVLIQKPYVLTILTGDGEVIATAFSPVIVSTPNTACMIQGAVTIPILIILLTLKFYQIFEYNNYIFLSCK